MTNAGNVSREQHSMRIVYPDANAPIAELMSGARLARIREAGDFAIHMERPESNAQFIERIADAHALMLGWGLPSDVMRAATNLELIAFVGIGAGNFVDLDAAAAQGITVCNTPGYADDTVAEHALAMMLALARHVARLDRDLRAGRWNQGLAGIELRGKRLGLVGFGGIGARMAELARGIGMQVRAWTRHPSAERARRHGIEFAELETLLGDSDVISVHAALTPETSGLLDAASFELMKPGVLIVNTARGEIIDEEALLAALDSGHVAGAALDVFHQEPLPAGHPLVALENVLLTPHVAYNTPEATHSLLDISIENIVRYARGNPVNVVAAPRK
ncbi:MAG: glycerate dehydrogenase [Gammaproteobacteria bacterium]|nr:glycerate dehydrogenase [Gammaproteobacteria bacterium]